MKIVKTTRDHAVALKRLGELMLSDPAPGSKDEEELELLGFLIEDYEKRNVKIPAATPAEAIRFRMEQAGLKQADLVPLIGSKSRVSEVISGKRELTLAMVRKLHEGLGIPLRSLVRDGCTELPSRIEPELYPVKEMFMRGFFAATFGGDWAKAKERAEEMLQHFFGGRNEGAICAYNRQTTGKKSKVNTDAVQAWRCRVLDRAANLKLPEYDPSVWDGDFIRRLTGVSRLADGPLRIRELLHGFGIALITEKHLTGTHLDGAAMWHPGGFPVVALTLRHDRLDNFWFTLFHELGHVSLHLVPGSDVGFVDADIDSVSEKETERQADRFALDAFIPEDQWDRLGILKLAGQIRTAARNLGIHESIIAGRLRREAGDYRKHRTLIGQGKVRELFWPGGE